MPTMDAKAVGQKAQVDSSSNASKKKRQRAIERVPAELWLMIYHYLTFPNPQSGMIDLKLKIVPIKSTEKDSNLTETHNSQPGNSVSGLKHECGTKVIAKGLTTHPSLLPSKIDISQRQLIDSLNLSLVDGMIGHNYSAHIFQNTFYAYLDPDMSFLPYDLAAEYGPILCTTDIRFLWIDMLLDRIRLPRSLDLGVLKSMAHLEKLTIRLFRFPERAHFTNDIQMFLNAVVAEVKACVPATTKLVFFQAEDSRLPIDTVFEPEVINEDEVAEIVQKYQALHPDTTFTKQFEV